ncbi:unnamed protein product [Adineta ricciae]|uniref:Uncharacterized protein n=1 Tax=Adineta ricciae TaxID=249248 RepID=A0A813R308_ADIRI|nr:unnamed protein product [Adineta ricciae]CAF1538382.1 unnamed protein product [Adineta ricciae]
MPRLGCDNHVEKPLKSVVDRVYDLRNRVRWLKNVEYCLLGDQTDRLTKIKGERHDMETKNNDLRKNLKTSEKVQINSFGKDISIVEGIKYVSEKETQLVHQHDQLLLIEKCLLHRLESLQDENCTNTKNDRLISPPSKQTEDLDLLRKELPNMQKDIGQKFDQRIILKKEFTDIVAENKRRLKIYQQLLAQTEIQSRQRRVIHEQAMTSITEQLEEQYQAQMISTNNMTTVFDSRRLTSTGDPQQNIEQQNSNFMDSDEIIQIRCMYDQFYNIIMAGLPIDIDHSKQLKSMASETSSKTVAMLTMTNRMIEEKEQITQQINRTDKLLKLIEMSIDCKNDIRHQILNTMNEQRQKLEVLYTNDSIEEQNRIVRHINDFVMVLSKALCKHLGTQILTEPPVPFIERLQYVFDIISKTVKHMADDEDHETLSSVLRYGDDAGSRNDF